LIYTCRSLQTTHRKSGTPLNGMHHLISANAQK
jgi:hypothetical protein